MDGLTTSAAPPTAARDSETVSSAGERDESKVSAAVVTIDRPAQELYDFWRDPGNLVGILENVESIEADGKDRSTWTVKAPGGRSVSWEAVITDDQPGREIAWESVEGSEIRNSGRISFTDAGDRGTVVRAVIAYDPPGGAIASLIAKLFQREPAIQARRDLRRFKQFMETGEVATSSRTLAHHAEHKAG